MNASKTAFSAARSWRPERPEAQFASFAPAHAEEVLEPVVLVQRVAFHVEVEVAFGRGWQAPEAAFGFRGLELEAGAAGSQSAHLHGRLCAGACQGVRCHLRNVLRRRQLRQCLHAADPGIVQAPDLGPRDAGHLPEMVVGDTLTLAAGIPAAGLALLAGVGIGVGARVFDRASRALAQAMKVARVIGVAVRRERAVAEHDVHEAGRDALRLFEQPGVEARWSAVAP